MNGYEELDKMIGEVGVYVADLLKSRYFFLEVRKIFFETRTRGLDPLNDFFKWIWKNYICSVLIGVRRLVDTDERCISLYNLLRKFKEKPELLSRARYVGFYQNGDFQVANSRFDEFVGKGKSHIDPKEIQKEMKLLIQKSKKLTHYVNKRIAHTDKEKIENLPTYTELDDCIDYLKKLAEKYWNLFDGGDDLRLSPSYQYDWKNILKVPWLPEVEKDS